MTDRGDVQARADYRDNLLCQLETAMRITRVKVRDLETAVARVQEIQALLEGEPDD